MCSGQNQMGFSLKSKTQMSRSLQLPLSSVALSASLRKHFQRQKVGPGRLGIFRSALARNRSGTSILRSFIAQFRAVRSRQPRCRSVTRSSFGSARRDLQNAHCNNIFSVESACRDVQHEHVRVFNTILKIEVHIFIFCFRNANKLHPQVLYVFFSFAQLDSLPFWLKVLGLCGCAGP